MDRYPGRVQPLRDLPRVEAEEVADLQVRDPPLRHQAPDMALAQGQSRGDRPKVEEVWELGAGPGSASSGLDPRLGNWGCVGGVVA